MTAPTRQEYTDSPPQPLSVEPDGVPGELKERPQWVNWRYAWDGKKWTKHPYSPRGGRKASSTDLLTWSVFEQVLETYEAERYDGVGFVFSSGDPFCGVDLDGCVDAETGEVASWAMQVIEGLDSYSELSSSGTGIHIICRGKLPSKGKRGPVEMYSQEESFGLYMRNA